MECPSRDQGWIPSTASGGSLSTPAPEDPSTSPSFLGHILMHANIHIDTPHIHRAAGSSVQMYTQAHHIYTELQVLCLAALTALVEGRGSVSGAYIVAHNLL